MGGLAKDPTTVEKLRGQSSGYPVKIITGAEFSKVIDLYSKARFFWHATGYEIDERIEPEKVEHFGMSTVEAMASGCIPLVIGKGGQKEIITKDTGYLCDDEKQIVSETIKLIHNRDKIDEVSLKAIERSKKFTINEFYKKINFLVTNSNA